MVGYDGFAPDYAQSMFPDVHVSDKFRVGCVPPTDDELRQLAQACGMLVVLFNMVYIIASAIWPADMRSRDLGFLGVSIVCWPVCGILGPYIRLAFKLYITGE